MSKKIKCDVKGFEGEVTFKQPLYFDDVFAMENALDESSNVEPSAFWTRINEATGKESAGVAWTSRTDVIFLKAILQCTEEINVNGIPAKPSIETFPMTPRGAVNDFVKFAWDELQKIYNGEIEIPNAS
jgi:hypothetical protein